MSMRSGQPAVNAAPKHASNARLLLPILALGLIMAVLAVAARGLASKPVTVSHVTREIRDIVLSEPDGGDIGPWHAIATSFDPRTGVFTDFRVESRSLRIASRNARLIVDPRADAFSFELTDVVYTLVPDEDHQGDEHYLLEMEHYLLGPVDYGHKIIADAAGQH